MSRSRKELLFSVVLVVILLGGVFIAPTILLNDDSELGVSEEFEVDEEVIEEQVEVALRCQFYENLGQVNNPDVKYYGNIPGGMIGFAESRILLWMEGADGVVTLSFKGARDVVPIAVEDAKHLTSYFLGCRGTFSNVPSFSSIVYKELWSGIDLVYQATSDGAKYEFSVAPGADPADIQVRCEGHDSLVIGETSLWIEKDDETLIDDGLRLFQGESDVEGRFISLGDSIFGISVGDYDNSEILVIDPMVYSTLVTGSRHEIGYGIAVDSSGNAYVTGGVTSTDFPTVNAYNSTGDGNVAYYDVFVLKLSSNGSNLLYSTYVSGSTDDIGYGIAVDSSGNAYVTGAAHSTDFPTVNAYNSTGDGKSNVPDVFVFKLNSTGSGLIYSTYVSGISYEYGKGIAVDSSGNAYVTGYTISTDFPTVNAYDAEKELGEAVIVFKLSPDGSSLLYSTFVDGTSADNGEDIEIDDSGNAYVTGWTRSTDFPTVNAYNATGDGSTSYSDVFVFKLSSDGSSLLYSTYIGGSAQDPFGERGYGIAVDDSGNAYVTGYTLSTDFPTVNAYDSTGDGILAYHDVFVFKLSSNGNSLLYSTYVGGNNHDYGGDIEIDDSGNAYVTGWTRSTDFPTVNAYNETGDGSTSTDDVFVFKLAANGSKLVYSTYIGGSDDDGGLGIAVDNRGDAYVTGQAKADFPTLNAYDMNDDGDDTQDDMFVFKLIEDYTIPDLDSPSDFPYEQSETGNQIIWTVGDITPNQYRVDGNGTTIDWTPWINGSIILNVDGLTPGVYNYTITVNDRGDNEAKDTVFVTVEDTISPDLDSPSDFKYEAGVTGNQITWTAGDINPHEYRVVGNGSIVDWTAWSNGSIIINVDSLPPGVYNHTIIVRDDYGNQAVHTVLVTVEDTTSPDLDSPDDLSYEQGATGNEIVWTASDLYPGQYRIDGNGTTVGWTDWSSGSITVNVDGFTLGIYTYTITVRDDYDNEVLDTVLLTVVDITGPVISNIQQSPVSPLDDEDVVIIANVTDVLSTVNSVKIFYRTRPQDGEWSDLRNVTMTHQSDDTYQGTIPVQVYATQVEYYVWSMDTVFNTADTSATPGTYTVGSTDVTGPQIWISHSPESPSELDDVVVTATVTDDSIVSIVTLQYSVDGGVTWMNVTMAQSGGQWTAPIPRQDIGTIVQYRVHAMDNIGNWETSSTGNYEVVSSIPPPDIPAMILLTGEIIGGILAIVGGYKAFRIWQRRRGLGKVPVQEVK